MPFVQGLGQPLDPRSVLRSHIESVRLFMRDFAELNLLIRGEESTDRMIVWATGDFLSDFNGTPPFTGYGLEELIQRNMSHLCVRGTVITLLQSVMLLHARNYLPFSDGGLSVAINDKAPVIQSMLQLFQSAYEQNKRQAKTALNIEQLLDLNASGVHSDYFGLYALGYW
jgi:hypothetical protein